MDHGIRLSHKGQHLLINQLGGGIGEYYVDDNGHRVDIIAGYHQDEEKTGSMGDVLFPFPGRVENCQYEFYGNRYTLSGLRIKDGHANHGFVKTALWEIVERSANQLIISYSLTKQDYAPKGYPFSLGIRLTYLLDDNGLTVKSDVTNTGDTPAPFGLGFHPYFTVGTDTVNDIAMQIKAKSLVEFDDILKPTGKFIDVSLTNFDFNHQKKIDDLVIDNAFSALIFTNGKNQTIISNNKNRQITIWQDESFPYLQIFSADTLSEPHRRKIFAVEPYTCTGFALNVPDMGLKVLQPKELFSGKWGVIPSVL